MIETLETIVAALAGFLVVFGALAFFAALLAPRLLEYRFSRWLLTGRMDPSRSNRILMSIWAVLLGGYLLLSVTDHRTLSFIAFALWLPIAGTVLIRSFRARS